MKYRVLNQKTTLLQYGFAAGLFLALLAFFIYNRYLNSWQLDKGSVFMIVFLSLLGSILLLGGVFGLGEEFLTIDEHGLTMKANRSVSFVGFALVRKRIFIPWSDVKDICLRSTWNGRFNRSCYIVFSTESYYPQAALRRPFDEKHVGLQYREGLADVIRKYTILPIRYIEEIEG